MDLFCSGITKNPSLATWIFSFVPQGTTSFRAKREHHCRPAAQMNDVAIRANDVDSVNDDSFA